MGKFKYRVYPEGDPPLVNGAEPVVVPEDVPDDTPARVIRWGYAVPCLAIWFGGAYLLGWGARWQEPLTPLLTGLWTAACGLATLRAIRRRAAA